MQQFHRVESYLTRVWRIYGGVPQLVKHTEEYEDDVISFFVHCHRLADWVIDHYANVTAEQEVHAFVNANPDLQLRADICNASKHCKLQRIRTGIQPSLRGRDWVIVTYRKELRKPVTFFGK